MRVFKFGGASVTDANGIRNVLRILRSQGVGPMILVFSAIGKTTNRLEAVLKVYLAQENPLPLLEEIRQMHYGIANELLGQKAQNAIDRIDNAMVEAEWLLEEPPSGDPDLLYDQLVSVGEILCSHIVSCFLNANGIANIWLDARDMIRTDNTYRAACIDWRETQQLTKTAVSKAASNAPFIVTQGFIGGTSENFTTTLGREGSDFTAAILAYCTQADDVTIWKDVAGVMNADPKYFKDTHLIDQMHYRDAMEIAYYGTSVIHPKTIKPLQNARIPLWVRSFLHPEKQGTLISDVSTSSTVASYIIKKDQTLFSVIPSDQSFVVEHHFREIFSALDDLRIKVNVMQNSAISFSFCADTDDRKIGLLDDRLNASYRIRHNSGCELITVRYFDDQTIVSLVAGRQALLEQRTLTSAQLVVKNKL